MKRIISLFLVVILTLIPFSINAEEVAVDGILQLSSQSETVEVGDQFLVNVKTNNPMAFLTFRVNGTFDSDKAEIVAPVYSNKKLGIITNKFDNEMGTFTFEGYDQTLRGTDEQIVCSILFKAKSEGEFKVNLDDCKLGKANENAFYNISVEDATVEVTADTDGENTVIIEEPEPQTPYDELIMGHWAEKGIIVMYKLGVLTNIADETIDTERAITRGEFATMLVRVCKLKSTAEVEPFADVPEDSYMYEPLKIIKARGIALGDGEGNFMPDSLITRQDAFSLIFRTMVKMNKVDSNIAAEEYIGTFTDKDSIATYAVDPVAGMFRAKLLPENDIEECIPEGEMPLGYACYVLNKLAEFNILVSRG